MREGSQCHGGRGEKRDTPCIAHGGQDSPPNPSKFLHSIVPDVLQAAEWV